MEAVLENELEEGLVKFNLTRENLDLKLTWDLEGEKMVLLEALQVPQTKLKEGAFLSLRRLTRSPSASSLWSMWPGF